MITALNKTVHFVLALSILFTVSEGESWKCYKKRGKFPIPGSCTSYYVCESFKVVSVETCPPDEHYNPIKEWCDWKDLYPCWEKPKHKECPKPNGRFLKNGTDCESYFDCCNGEPIEKKCSKGLLFDAESGKCDYEELVDCDGSSKNKECPIPNGHFLKPGTKCRSYFECSKGKPKEKKCPKHQLFNVKSGKCDWKDRVTCEESQKEKCPKSTGRFLKLGTDCKVYYECYKGQATEKLCPKHLLFDSKVGKCVKKELVTCKDRETSSESSSSESNESNESTRESTPADKISSPLTSPDTISERFISDFNTDEVTETKEENKSPSPLTDSTTQRTQSPLPFTDSTTEDIESPLPTTDDTSREVSTSELYERTTLASQTPEIRFESSTQAIVSTPQITTETTNRQSTDQDIFTSPKITKPSSHPTEFTSDLPTILDLTSTPTQEDIIYTDSTAESSPEPFTRETTEEIFSSTYLPTENPEVSTIQETSSSYHTELPTSHATSETASEGIFTDSEQSSSSFVTTESSNTDDITKTTRETEISIDTTTETITSMETNGNLFTSSTSDVHQSTIDPVLVGFVCPEQTGYYPHPTNRRKFIGCVHGNAYIMDCPSNLVYNHEQRRCLYDN